MEEVMVQLPQQPHVFRRPDLLAFDGLPMIDRAFCSALRVARTLGDDYATEGMDLEEVSLAHTMENLLYTIPQKCEAALGEHPTDIASFERWSNLDMIDCLWWMLQEEKTKVQTLGTRGQIPSRYIEKTWCSQTQSNHNVPTN